MTTYFVTVGMSLLTSSRCWAGLEDLDCLSPDQLRDPDTIMRRANQFSIANTTRRGLVTNLTRADAYETQAKYAILDHLTRLKSSWESKPALLPAELATLRIVRRVFREGDQLFLLHGKNDNEKVAHLLKAILDAYVQAQRLPAITIDLAGPFDWEPTQNPAFQFAMQDLWEAIKNRLPNDSPSAFILTGAYKAILMDLAVKICANQIQTTIYYLHEDGTEVIQTKIERRDGNDPSFMKTETSHFNLQSVENEPEH